MALGHSIAARPQSSSGRQIDVGSRDWRLLDADGRLRMVARALSPSDGLVDRFPLAL